jgi:peptidoglycan/xylan/chitin deacetylase (PgdA/CDA1 family)
VADPVRSPHRGTPSRRPQARALVDRFLTAGPGGRAAAIAGALRGRGIALLWHRVHPAGASPDQVVRATATTTFAEQLEVLADLGDIVPLRDLETPHRGTRPRFALTFDDDDPGHVRHTLPVLLARDVPATFFLSGRWRDRWGPYWWELVEAAVRRDGPVAVALRFGLHEDLDPPGVAQAITGSPTASRLATETLGTDLPVMTRADAKDLVTAGMEVGFHTLHHPSLPSLPAEELATAVAAGREELAADLGTRVERFAYPHGHADGRAVAAVRATGYRSAWTTAKRGVVAAEDRMLLGRWDLSRHGPDSFRRALLRGLLRPSP